MTPDDFAQIAAQRATFNTSRPSSEPGAGPPPDHISDVIKAAYTPEVYAMYDDEDLEDETP